MPAPSTIPARITIVALHDPVTERNGFAADSCYVEYCLLPAIGPAGILLYRHLARLVRSRERTVIDLAQVARSLGLRADRGRNAPVAKTLRRLEVFGLAAWRPNGDYALRRATPPLADHHARRLPQPARSIHYRAVAAAQGGDRP